VTRTGWLTEILAERVTAWRLPGAAAAVLHDGTIETAAAGTLNVDTGVEATTDSLFEIGSITKVYTATLVMQLVDAGLVELDAPIRRYVPDFRVADAAASDAITVRHLLTHTSGFDGGDYFFDGGRGDNTLHAASRRSPNSGSSRRPGRWPRTTTPALWSWVGLSSSLPARCGTTPFASDFSSRQVSNIP
jgi:CubicO group peptidase (beta-lactamase class C family)